MPYRTVNLKPATYRRLVEYKHGGMSFDDVLCAMMDMVPEDQLRAMTSGSGRRVGSASNPQTPSMRGRVRAGDGSSSAERTGRCDESPDEIGRI